MRRCLFGQRRLGGSWVVIGRVIGVPLRVHLKRSIGCLGLGVVISGALSPLSRVISIVRGLITPLIATHEPPSRLSWYEGRYLSKSRFRAV